MFRDLARRAMRQPFSDWEIDETLKQAVQRQQEDKAPKAHGNESIILGLDLGQSQDPAALVILRRSAPDLPTAGTPFGRAPGRYDCLKAHRWMLGTAYTHIVDVLCERLEDPALAGATLVVDATGERSVIDQLRKARPKCKLVPVMITGGQSQSAPDAAGYWHVSKTVLVNTAVVLTELHRVRWPSAEKEPTIGVLVRELQSFKLKVTKAANESFEAEAGKHDDLVMALALALWFGESGNRQLKVW